MDELYIRDFQAIGSYQCCKPILNPDNVQELNVYYDSKSPTYYPFYLSSEEEKEQIHQLIRLSKYNIIIIIII